jgi:hypothetical protein
MRGIQALWQDNTPDDLPSEVRALRLVKRLVFGRIKVLGQDTECQITRNIGRQLIVRVRRG